MSAVLLCFVHSSEFRSIDMCQVAKFCKQSHTTRVLAIISYNFLGYGLRLWLACTRVRRFRCLFNNVKPGGTYVEAPKLTKQMRLPRLGDDVSLKDSARVEIWVTHFRHFTYGVPFGCLSRISMEEYAWWSVRHGTGLGFLRRSIPRVYIVSLAMLWSHRLLMIIQNPFSPTWSIVF